MKEHYATRLKREIKELLKKCNEYYDANYDARQLVRGGSGGSERYGGMRLGGTEQGPACYDVETLRKTILDLPL